MSRFERDTPNPLRPYYKPPSIGIPQDAPATHGTASSSGVSGSTHRLGPRNGSAASYASSARDIFNDLDYADYLSDNNPSNLESIQKQINDWTSRYFGVLLAQPFDVAKTILQIRHQGLVEGASIAGSEDGRSRSRSSYRDDEYPQPYHQDSDSEGDETTYFTSNAPSSPYGSYSSRRTRERAHAHISREFSPPPPPVTPDNQLVLKRHDSILEVISQEWSKEGAWGVWKASNATFIYSLLHKTLEHWAKGMYSALLNVPDQGLAGSAAELVDAQYPWTSLGVAIGAAVTAGLILSPLDLVRTKLIITSINTPSRSLTQSVRNLPSYIIPAKLFVPTLFYELITPTLHHSTPLLLRSHLSLDPVLTPGVYSLAKFASRTAELFIKLPFETVLRRAQADVLTDPSYTLTSFDGHGKPGRFEPIVQVGEYRGLIGTMWSIAREEGTREEIVVAKKGKTKAKTTKKNGQGIEGLWRGWRVGWWGLVGVWGSGLLGGGADGGEF